VITKLFGRGRRGSPDSDRQIQEPYHVALVVYEIKKLVDEALEPGPEHVRPRDSSLREILYRTAYVLNLQRGPIIEMAVDASLGAGGFDPAKAKSNDGNVRPLAEPPRHAHPPALSARRAPP
jgi:hypothetical protein